MANTGITKQRKEKEETLDPRCTGKLAPIACGILMQVLYTGRYARADVQRCISMMACCVTKWTTQQDQELDDTMGYILYSAHWLCMGWKGDPQELLTPHLFANTDLAGCQVTERSTSGLFLAVRGTSSCFPIAFLMQKTRCMRSQHRRSGTNEHELCSQTLRFAQLDSQADHITRTPGPVLPRGQSGHDLHMPSRA